VACERHLAGCHAFNPGPISLPRRSDNLARWAVVEATDAGYTIEYRTVPYDLANVVDDLRRQRHPAERFLTAKMTERR
jgi:hypothetical protein